MTMEPRDPLTRLDELLADRALQGLCPEEQAELDALLAAEDDSLEMTASQAAAFLARTGDAYEPIPADLASRIQTSGMDRIPVAFAPARRFRPLPYLGWLAAAASWLLVLWRATPPPEAPTPPTRPVVSLTVEQRRERLLALASVKPLNASEHPLARGASGDLVWDPKSQEGYLNLKGLAATNPQRGIYQLWIFDAKRDQRYPVDGGTFAIDDPDRPTVVPIRAQIPVNDATLFAITLEPPGGVVVSDRKRIMLTAK